MLLPALLPNSLTKYETEETEQGLLQRLIQNPADLLLFFEYACDDETWSEKYSEFTKGIMRWLTFKFYFDKLSVGFARKIVKCIYPHIEILDPFLPHNILVKVRKKKFIMNSLLLGASSDFFRRMLLQECRDKRKRLLVLEDVSPELFSVFEEYIHTGKVNGLWRKNEDELIEILDQALRFELYPLARECEQILKRYIDRTNVISKLLVAHQKGMNVLKNACIDYFNKLDFGVKFEKMHREFLGFEFLEFQERGVEIFDQVKQALTHLIIGGTLTQNPTFAKVVKNCPRLLCLDISRTDNFSQHFHEIPATLKQLDISMAPWLSQNTLRTMVRICPELDKLMLRNNVELSYAVWAELKKLPQLRNLDVAGCSQIGDREIGMILQACPGLIYLNISNCRRISEKGFLELAWRGTNFHSLDMSMTNITDTLLVQLTQNAFYLHTLNISRSRGVTERGVLETIRQCHSLRYLDIGGLSMPHSTISEIKRHHPLLKIKR